MDFRRLVLNYSWITPSLKRTLGKQQPRVYTELSYRELDTLHTAQERTVSSSMLAVLMERHLYGRPRCMRRPNWARTTPEAADGHDSPIIANWTRSLTDTERACDINRQEWVVVVRAVLLLFPYLKGTCFIIRRDQNTLKEITNLAHAPAKLIRWSLQLPETEFDVIQCVGIDHQDADELSGLPTTEEGHMPNDERLPVMALVFSPKEHEKVGTENTDVIDDYEDN